MREDIKQWLNELGLGQYADTFARESLNFEHIRGLTESEMRELGLSMGHRKVLLKAIADLAPSEPPVPAASVAERRQLTVMFCDLVDSTGLAHRYDPEVLREITKKFRLCCETAVKRFGGKRGGVRGDGLLIYFGYPEANEHDPERAIRAGLELVKSVRELETRPDVKLDSRVGIATGEVVVGDVVGSELTQERDVVGVVPNLASRLQQTAEQGTVVVSDITRRLVGDLFEYSEIDLRASPLKGFPENERAWRVEAELPFDNRFAATHPVADLTPLVGRELELTKLLRHWNLAQTGRGQAVLLTGEPGIGKSRMVHSLLEKVQTSNPALIRCFCVEHQKNSALFPIISLVERLAHFERGDSTANKLDKLDKLLQSSGAADVAPFYAALLSLPTADRYPPLSMTADVQKERTLAALEAQVKTAAASNTVLLIMEDMHWADPTTEELIARILRWLPQAAVLLLMTARPEFAPAWARSERVSTLSLRRLNHDNSRDVVSHVSASRSIPREIEWEIVAKSDGIPLYLEEITKAVVERGFQDVAGTRNGRVETSVPNTLQDSLAARLDRLPGAKRVAQIGATIGRQFSYELLAAVCTLPKAEVAQALNHLTAAEVLTCSGTLPNSIYTFKHALLQDWAYENQLKTERSRLHKSIARILEERFPDEVAAQPQVLADHYSKAGEYHQAIAYWQRAAKRSADRAAYAEALKHLGHALDHLDKLADGRERDRLELELRVALGLSLERTRGYSAPEVEQTYERARELCHKLGETVELVPVLVGLYVFRLVRANQKNDLTTALELAEQCVQLSKDSGRDDYLIDSYAAMGYVLCYLGRLDEAREVLEKGVELYELRWGELKFTITAQDPGVASLALLGIVLWMLGNSNESLKRAKQAFAWADELGEPINHAIACAHAAQLHSLRREPERAVECAEKGFAISKQNGYPTWESACAMFLGIAKAMLGDATYGIGSAKKYLEAWQAAGAGLNRPYFLAGIAQAEIVGGRRDEALAHLTEALEHAEQTGEAYFVPLIYEIRGECLANLADRAADAEADFRRSNETAKAENAKMFELRSLRSLLRLKGAGNDASLRSELARLVEEVGADGDTLDVREAKELCS